MQQPWETHSTLTPSPGSSLLQQQGVPPLGCCKTTDILLYERLGAGAQGPLTP